MTKANYKCPNCGKDSLRAEGNRKFVCRSCGENVKEILEYLSESDCRTAKYAARLLEEAE